MVTYYPLQYVIIQMLSNKTNEDISDYLALNKPLLLQGRSLFAQFRFLWHQIQAPSDLESHTCILHSASSFATHMEDKPVKHK